MPRMDRRPCRPWTGMGRPGGVGLSAGGTGIQPTFPPVYLGPPVRSRQPYDTWCFWLLAALSPHAGGSETPWTNALDGLN
jgi:hypothetical protein